MLAHFVIIRIMKKYIAWILFVMVAFMAGCGRENKETEKIESDLPVKIAVIDTGFSTKAIPTENRIEGRNYLHPAVEKNLIRMTIPDKPNSRNQKYVKI